MGEITIKVPLELIKEILRRVPHAELEKLQKRPRKRKINSVPADHLLKLTGIIAIGGNAMEDTEKVWQ